MQSQMRKRFVGFGMALGLGLICAGSTSAKSTEDNTGAGQDHSIVGTWMSHLTRADGTFFLSLATYFPDGIVIDDANGATFRTGSQGEWVRTGPRQFRKSTVLFNFTTTSRVFSNIQKVVSVIELNREGDEYTSTNSIETYDTHGNLVSIIGNTGVSRRCGLDDSIPSCLGTGP